jgi:hypothetical protein
MQEPLEVQWTMVNIENGEIANLEILFIFTKCNNPVKQRANLIHLDVELIRFSVVGNSHNSSKYKNM